MKHLRHILSLGMLIALVSSASAQSWLTNGLVAYYPFNGNGIDYSGKGNNLNTTGYTFITDQCGVISNAIYFSYGTPLSIPNSEPWDDNVFSFSVWVKFDSSGLNTQWPQVTGKRADYSLGAARWVMSTVGSTTTGWDLLVNNSYTYYPNNTIQVYTPILPKWTHLCGTFDGSVLNLYIDGLLGGQTFPGGSSLLSGATRPLVIGGNGYPGADLSWQGGIGRYRYYNRALSSNEVAQLYAIESTPALALTNSQNLFIGGGTDGNITEIIAGTTNPLMFCTNVLNGWPNCLAFNSKADLFVTCGGVDSVSYFPKGTNTPINISPSGLWYPTGLAIDANDNIFVADYNANVIWKIDGATKSGSLFCNTGISGPANIVFDSNGNLFIANYNNSSISIIPAGQNVAHNVCNTGLDHPFFMVRDSHGNLFLDNASGILKLPVGNSVPVNFCLGLRGALAMDANDNLFIASSVTNQISVIYAGTTNPLVYNANLINTPSALAFTPKTTTPFTPQLPSDLTNVTAVVGGDATFAVAASGAGPFSYQWFYTNSNPLAVAGGYPLSIAGFVYGVTITNGGFGYGSAPDVRFVGGSYALPAAGFATVSNGSVSSITVTNPGLNYTVLPAVVIDPPSGLLVDQTNSTLTISNVGPSNLGSYWVVVSNGGGSVTSSVANITLLYPPSIAVPPVSQNLALRGATTLSVTAAGTPPFSYQWTLAGTNLPSATNSTLAVTNFSLAQAGNYAVRVSSPYGTATSSSAQVSMLPSLNVPFAGGVNLWGQPATLTVGAVGTGPLVYQWYFNGQTIAGATSNSYTIPTIQFTNAGFYSVVVSSSLGSVTNTPYQVVVNPANVSLELCPKVVIQGTVGYSYSIQSTTNLANTNSWVVETNVTLTQPIQNWHDDAVDTTKSTHPRKFYRVTAAQFTEPVGMALIPAGPFTMGDTLDGLADAAPVTVTVSAFYMDTNVVSKAQWDDVYSWALGHGYAFDNVGSGKASTHPVQMINWFDSVKWCNARSEKEGRAPAYYTDAGLTTVYRSGQLSPSVNWAVGYRLPTEAEWEKAARGGLNQNRFPWGNTISQSLANFRNWGGESYQTGPTGYNAAYANGGFPYTSPVGSFAPNGYGLFDMAGNVWQWCWDWYGTPYAGGTDPRGAASGSYRVFRGGGWDADAFICRTAFRNYDYPANSGNNVGFRSVLPPGQ